MKSVKDMVAAANTEVAHMPASDAVALHGHEDVVFVDIRDIRELWREGRVPGSYHCPRGMLEFWIDPASPYAKPIFQSGKRFVFYCAGGQRSALAAKAAQDMGLQQISHIDDGFAGWCRADLPVEPVEKK
ncbi:MAG: rhodanese-like domain-containing protein [Pseudomonadota bacterium]